MSDFTTNLQLPYLMPAQAQKHVTMNEAIARLDVLCQANAISMSTTAQPGSPGDGDVYIIPSGKTGTDWASATDGSIGYYQDGVWRFVIPGEGWLVWVKDEDGLFAWSGSAWVQVDVVTTESVRTAGAVMDDELANLAAVKAINQQLATTSSPQFARVGLGAASSSQYRILAQEPDNLDVARFNATDAAYGGQVLRLIATRAANAVYGFVDCRSGNDTDREFLLRGDGNGFCDDAWNGGGADYAEYFEWADGNPEGDDRRGFPVVIVSEGMMRVATSDDDPTDIIGVVSGNPSVVGDTAWNRWTGKYLRDDFGAYLLEPYSAVEWIEPPKKEGGEPVIRSYALDELPEGVTPPESAVTRTTDDAGNLLMRRVLNPAFDPDTPYTPRSERSEWAAVGLVGKLRLRKGQPAGDRWIKMRDVSAAVEEWLVR